MFSRVFYVYPIISYDAQQVQERSKEPPPAQRRRSHSQLPARAAPPRPRPRPQPGPRSPTLRSIVIHDLLYKPTRTGYTTINVNAIYRSRKTHTQSNTETGALHGGCRSRLAVPIRE